MIKYLFLLAATLPLAVLASPAFVSPSKSLKSVHLAMSEKESKPEVVCPHPFSQLPGDPSLLLVTNLDLGDKKLDIMKECSKAISTATGKPEAYIGVSITDNASVIFGGSDDPCALGNLYSIGAIAMESNGQIQVSNKKSFLPVKLVVYQTHLSSFFSLLLQICWSRLA